MYDPSKKRVVDTISFPGLTGNPVLHSSGVQIDPLDRLSVTVNAGAAFDTQGKDISGDNFLVKYDLKKKRVLWQRNLTAVTNGVYGGYQDIEHDRHGNSFVVGTFPSSIIKVSADGKTATPWYLTPDTNHTIQGFTSMVTKGNMLIVSDERGGKLHRFDMRDKKGKPVQIAVGKASKPIGAHLDGLNMPSRYHGTVILASSNDAGTIVLRSKDGKWKSAENLGVVPNTFIKQNGFTTATAQIGQRIFAVTEFFFDTEKVPGTLAGNRTEFPLRDITAAVDKLLR